MPAGTEYIDIHNPLLFIDGQGNLVLDTQGKLAEQVEAGNIPGFVGAGIPTEIVISNAAGGTQYYSAVTFQVADVFGNPVKAVFDLDVLLSDAATGSGLTGTTASGGVTLTTGASLIVLTAAKAIKAQTDVNGKVVMQIIDSAKTGFYPVGAFGALGTFVGKQLTTASYHA
jgi:hypothetical protein